MIPTHLSESFDNFVDTHLSKRVQLMDQTYGPSKQEATFKNKATPVPDEWKSYMKDVYRLYPDLPKGSVESTLMMESSMGTNKRNQKSDYGEYGYIGGHIENGHFSQILNNYKKNPNLDYKVFKSGVPGIEDMSTPQAAIYGTGSVLSSLQKNNPSTNPADIYFKRYNANPQVDTPDRRLAYNDYLSQYSR